MNYSRISQFLFRNTPFIIFFLLFASFGIAAPRFFSFANLENIFVNASYIGIVAVGMTFVLLTGGIDLSVGSNMYLCGIIGGLLIQTLHIPPATALVACVVCGALFGALNALFIVKLRIIPFIVTLSTMIAGRGLGLLITRSSAMNFPESMTLLGAVRVGGAIPLPIVIFGCVVLLAHIFLEFTPLGRQIYATGNDSNGACKAGIDTGRVYFGVYILCGACAALGGFISVAQMGIINAGFGRGDEFDAIASAVLGGTSLFGGIGSVFPGTILGTIMIQMVQAGLVFSSVDLYIQPMIMALIIFLTVYLDSMRNRQILKAQRRHIMKKE